MRSRDWEEEKARYVLAPTSTSSEEAAIAYKLRDEARRDDEPTHFICPYCYEDRIKSILQTTGRSGVLCPRCNGR